MRTDIQFLQDNFLDLKTLYFRNSRGFYLPRIEILELDISKVSKITLILFNLWNL